MEKAPSQSHLPAASNESNGPAAVYSAHPLHLSHSTNIRLISKAPGDTTHPSGISLQIQTFALEDAPPFVALSYVWGSPEPCQTVSLDGCDFLVRQNLFDFLQEYWRRERSGFLWIDAICIDQTSIPERNHQVVIMGQIYSLAHGVISWLGAGPPKLVEAVKELSRFEETPETPYVGHWYMNPSFMIAQEVFGEPFCEAEYWHRAWIVQEIVLAKDFEIWCGQETMSSASWTLHATSLRLMRIPSPICVRAYKLSKFRSSIHGRYKGLLRNLDDLLDVGLGKCSDPKDRIYSVLSLFYPDAFKNTSIVVDYSMSASELFVQVVEGYNDWFFYSEYKEKFMDELKWILDLSENPKVSRFISDWKTAKARQLYLLCHESR